MKWIIALVIFMVVMGITFSDVEGINLPPGSQANSNTKVKTAVKTNIQNSDATAYYSFNDGTDGKTNSVPSAVPEPGTLILISTGLAAMYTVRRNRTN